LTDRGGVANLFLIPSAPLRSGRRNAQGEQFMADDAELRQDLLDRIAARREALRVFLGFHRPRIRRLATFTIVLTSLAALFTAGPAFGGDTFSHAVQKALGLSTDSYVWRTLCVAALLVSVAAALMTNIGRSQEAVTRLSAAEAASVAVEGLTTRLQFGQLPVSEAAKLYQQYTVKIPFVEELPVTRRTAAGPWDRPRGSL
jgi:hypothetical protein